MVAIETSKLTRKFGNLVAVEDLTIEVMRGEVLGFLGPNGAGKTTTVRMLAGIIAPTSGHAVVAGIRTDHEIQRLHEVIGLLTETPGFYERLSARRNLQFFARFYSNIDADGQVDKYLKIMGLWGRRNEKVGSFSKGMKQRLALARALLHEPEVLLLDEPTAGLDPEAAREVRELIEKLKQEGRSIFLCTHNLEEAERLSDRIAVFRTRLVVLDTPANLRSRLFRRQVIVDLESVDDRIIRAVKSLDFVQSVKKDGLRLTLELTDLDKNRPDLVQSIIASGGRVQSVFEKRHSLEEIYMTLLCEEEEMAAAESR
ncbi:ABC-2 type transport system ATP-binding protein [Candidatus Hakubella thermalkaliphila]|uniref:ABC-2 type transport system ATP-binding protein n=2 Tax=Candidatus Hakubella thermalkaliphila TaxID=2754717 RepID=A0A6V8PHY7_9ACTN|nr:ABC-2 type transport system ATP-binding protein [Candidatus Hakubella thermalkaliphila]GFP42285.1 ABC-2 type transport system ATP-binding protein [Candidatus Hakubella thermalkaliphila]